MGIEAGILEARSRVAALGALSPEDHQLITAIAVQQEQLDGSPR
jgi:hypothetical protein